MNVRGIEDFNQALTALRKDVSKRVIASALRAAAKPIIQQAKANAPVAKKTYPKRIIGLVRDNIAATTSRLSRRRGDIGLFIKPKRKKGVRPGKLGDPYYYRWLITGYHAVGRKRVAGGRRTRGLNLEAQRQAGRIKFISPQTNFLQNAFAAKSGDALNIFQTKLKTYIDNANKRK